ncbi:hypothetical protein [Pectobacterium carotovorum]|uniref:hypothetical protein n=1 Tax=Pectobacterium carotovorum TaxID=554 RepID=UPI0004FFFB64|nr:hypothetical protein [Pectobacterium carotovorum]KFX00788.1 hypothetical protein JV33_05145 [Pectobacterium carotovorum subsp. carotovorum]KML70368.1 hypothetical protein G032_08440 [Pectobacterium carotovorum subsp. carotovorum ICMP 5702]SHG93262.1 hypothetical protein SAMN05444147_105129 [Pectobacterium carotovorum]
MSAINLPTSPAFKMALLRHYIANAFLEAMTTQHGQAVYVLNGSRIPLTADKVAINIISHIEAPYIDQFGCVMGQAMAAQALYEMLEPGFMREAVRLSAYGYCCLLAMYAEIASGATDGELPPGAVVETLTTGGTAQ